MNQNRNDGSGAVIGIVAGALALAAALLFFAVAFIAFVLTLICIGVRLDNKPQHLGDGKWLTPQDAEEFLQRGAIGAFAVPAFLIFLEAVSGGLNINLRESLLPAAGFGYVLFSMLPLLEGEGLTQVDKNIEVLPPQPRFPTLDEQMRMNARKEEPPPFRYAQWDDDDVRD